MSRDDLTDDSPARRAVSIVVAARRLNLTSDAVRLRLKRRTLEGYRDNRGRWMVYLDSARPDHQAADRSDATTEQSPDQASLIKDLLARLETLEKERPAGQAELIAELRARLADRSREAEQLRLDLERERVGAADRMVQHKAQQEALSQQVADLLSRIDDKDRRHEQERRDLQAQVRTLTDSLAGLAADRDRRSLWQRLFGRGERR